MPVELDEVGPWSEVKLDIIREYAAPYSRILSGKFHHLYIDGFAGPGSHVSRTTGEIIPGSPLNALAIQPPFREYHFIDADPGRVGQLREHAGDRTDVHVYPGDCNRIRLDEVLPKARYEDYKRALCVLDPYNIDLSWDLVATAGRMKSVELFINFMVMDMNMNVLLSDPDRADAAQVARMNRFWGDASWKEVAYSTQNLFEWVEKVQDSNEKIAEAYRQRLTDVAGFKYVPRPLPFLNSTRATIYYLFFASPDPTGKKIVEDIFAKHRKRQGL